MPPEETEIRQAARAVIPFLDELLGAQRAEALAKEISAAPDDERIVELASSEPAVSEWIADYLDAAASSFRDYTRLSGDPGPVALSAKFRCPQGTLVWYRRFVGVEPPKCPVHGVELVRVDNGDLN